MRRKRRSVGTWFHGCWLLAAAAALMAPLLPHFGFIDAMRQPIIWLGCGFVLLAFFRKRRWMALAHLSGLALLLAPWADLGSMPATEGTRQLSVILLPSSSETAVRYAISAGPDLILIPDLSDATLAPLDLLAADYRTGILDAGEGMGIFLRNDIVGPDDIRRRAITSGSRAVALDATLAGTDVTIVVAHLHRPFPLADFGLQVAESQQLGKILADIPRPIILAGDFNALPWSANLRQLLQDMSASNRKWPGTFPSNLPAGLRLALDQVLVSDGLYLAEAKAGPDMGSVHLPLEATVTLPPR